MSTRRERFFRCRIESNDEAGPELVLQAWDAEAAVTAFREELALQGLPSAGEVRVEELTGRLALPTVRPETPPGAAAGA